jgi:hypothetical protein
MKLDDGKGVIIDTESKPPTTQDQIEAAQYELGRLKAMLKQQTTRQAYQRIQVAIESQQVKIKHLIKKYEKEWTLQYKDGKRDVKPAEAADA